MPFQEVFLSPFVLALFGVLTAVLFAPKGGPDGVAHYMVKSMAQLRRLLGG